MDKRLPVGIYILAGYFLLLGIYTLGITGYALLTGVSVTGAPIADPTAHAVSLALAIGLGVLNCVTAAGLWKRQSWARWIVVVIAALNFVLAFIAVVRGDLWSLAKIVLTAVIVWYMLGYPPVQKIFAHQNK